jgi:hypothetical protein
MAGPSDTLGRPWPTLAIRPWDLSPRRRTDLIVCDFLMYVVTRDRIWSWERRFFDFRLNSLEDEDRRTMGVRQGVARDSLMFHPGPPCLTLLRPKGWPPLKRRFSETALRSFQVWPARRTGGLQLSSTFLDTPRRTPMGLVDPNRTHFHLKNASTLCFTAFYS